MSTNNLFKDLQIGEADAEDLIQIPTAILNGGEGEPDDKKGDPKQKDTEEIEIPDSIIQGDDKDTGLAPSDNHNQSSSPFSALANAFVARGHLSAEKLEAFSKITTEDGFEKFLDLYEEHRIDNDTSLLTESQREYLEGLKSGVPDDQARQHANTINAIDNNFSEDILRKDDEAGKQARYTMFVTELTQKGIDLEEAKEIAVPMVEKADAVERAIKARNSVRAKFVADYETVRGTYKKQQETELDKEKASIEEVRKVIFDKGVLFDGKVKLSDKMKEKVYHAVSTIVGETANGKPMNAIMKAIEVDPVNVLPKLGYVWVMTNGLNDLSGFNAKAMTDATRALEAITARPTLSGAYSPANVAANEVIRKSGSELVDSLRAFGL